VSDEHAKSIQEGLLAERDALRGNLAEAEAIGAELLRQLTVSEASRMRWFLEAQKLKESMQAIFRRADKMKGELQAILDIVPL